MGIRELFLGGALLAAGGLAACGKCGKAEDGPSQAIEQAASAAEEAPPAPADEAEEVADPAPAEPPAPAPAEPAIAMGSFWAEVFTEGWKSEWVIAITTGEGRQPEEGGTLRCVTDSVFPHAENVLIAAVSCVGYDGPLRDGPPAGLWRSDGDRVWLEDPNDPAFTRFELHANPLISSSTSGRPGEVLIRQETARDPDSGAWCHTSENVRAGTRERVCLHDARGPVLVERHSGNGDEAVAVTFRRR